MLDDFPLEELVPYIDWTFFFTAWELKGRFPKVLDHPRYGAAARELYDHARTLLEQIVAGRLIRARAVWGLWPAHSEDDDVVLFGFRIVASLPVGSVPSDARGLYARRTFAATQRLPMSVCTAYAKSTVVAPLGNGMMSPVGVNT